MLEVKYRSDEREIFVFKQHLGDNLDIVSFSTLLKKLPFILKDLSNLTFTKWKSVVTLQETLGRIEIIHKRPNDAIAVYIFSFEFSALDFIKMTKLTENIMKQVRKRFSIERKKMPAVIQLVDGTKFIFSLYENNNTRKLIEFSIKSIKPKFNERISTWLFRRRHPEKECTEILVQRELSGEMVL